MEPEAEPDEPYKRGLYALPLDVPAGVTITIKNSIDGLKDGRCELLIRQQEMPPIDDLVRELRYAHGLAMRFIGFSLDQVDCNTDDALRIYGELAEAADAHMERHRLGECGPFLVDHLIDALLRVTGRLFADIDIRSMIEEYVSRVSTQTPRPDDRQIPPGSVSVDDSIWDECRALLGNVPTFHIPSHVFDQCETSAWIAVRWDMSMLPCSAFLIAVDGETWLPVKRTPITAQSEWLLVDARDPQWYLYERAKFRGVGVKANAAQIAGVTCDTRTGRTHAVPSTSIYVEEAGTVRPATWNDNEASRLVRVAVTFILLLRNERVMLKPGRIIGHWDVVFPDGWSVDQLVDEILPKKAG